MTMHNRPSDKRVDFNLHDLVGIRLIGATAGDVAAVRRQLGPIQAPYDRNPEITIRFVDHIELDSTMRYLGVDQAGFTQDAFFALKGKHKSKVKAQIPFGSIGQPCEIICERGINAVPLLIPILNLTALDQGILPLHAAGFNYNDQGILVSGWSKGGKTEALLAFAAHGAEYIGDEWIYLIQKGTRMFGIPEPIRVWDWHLDSMPAYRSMLTRYDRARLSGLHISTSLLHQFSLHGNGSKLASLSRRVLPLFTKQQHVDIAPERLFSAGLGSLQGQVDKVLFVASHESPEITVLPIDAQEVAQRMVFSLEEERQALMTYYNMYRFAFPSARNPLLEDIEQKQRDLLTKILRNKDAYAVFHPYPVEIPELYKAIAPMI